MLLNNKLCADAGSVNCPCYLAEYGKCIVCRRLQAEVGEDPLSVEATVGPGACDCCWQGVCIYNEYLQNNKCITGQRQTRLCKIQKIKWFGDDLAVMRISVPRGIAEKAALPGSFVFVKSPGTPEFFSFPLSVMRADYEGGFVELAVKVQGPKSTALLNSVAMRRSGEISPIGDATGTTELRGLYRNGLLGGERLTGAFVGSKVSGTGASGIAGAAGTKRVLCLTKGIGLAPVANYIRWAGERDRVDVIADLEKISRDFAEYALEGCRIASLRYGRLPLNLSWAEEEKYDVIVISASEYYQQNIYVPEAKKVLSNNHAMCCGEGICGACIRIDGNGVPHNMCKCCNDSMDPCKK